MNGYVLLVVKIRIAELCKIFCLIVVRSKRYCLGGRNCLASVVYSRLNLLSYLSYGKEIKKVSVFLSEFVFFLLYVKDIIWIKVIISYSDTRLHVKRFFHRVFSFFVKCYFEYILTLFFKKWNYKKIRKILRLVLYTQKLLCYT